MAQPAPTVRCPTCGAAEQAGPTCRRCRSDLRLLQRLEADRSTEQRGLARALVDGRWADALLSAQYIHILRQDETSFRMLTVCQLLNDQLEAAQTLYRQQRTGTSPHA